MAKKGSKKKGKGSKKSRAPRLTSDEMDALVGKLENPSEILAENPELIAEVPKTTLAETLSEQLECKINAATLKKAFEEVDWEAEDADEDEEDEEDEDEEDEDEEE